MATGKKPTIAKKAAAPKKAADKTVDTVKAAKETASNAATEAKTDKQSLVVYDVTGTKSGIVAAPAALFGGDVNMQLIAQAVRVYLANQREGSASTKTRGKVEGSTRKIYKQKGTGRARHGSIRAPIFVGGGIVFGPQPRDYSLHFPGSMKNAAIKSALALKLKEEKIVVMEDAKMTKPATKTVAAAFTKIGATRSVLLVVDDMHTNLVKSARNICCVTVEPAKNVTTYEVFTSHRVVITKEALKQLESRLA
ncbi:MAG: 50S ribosomal protein L4 [Microgenomates group bacterium]